MKQDRAELQSSGELTVLRSAGPGVPPGRPASGPVAWSAHLPGTEMMKVHEAGPSMVGKARTGRHPDQVRKVLDNGAQQGAMATYKKVMNKLES